MKKTLFIILYIVLIPVLSFSQTISGVSGTISNGQSITISGSSFGSNGPTVILFDDFEGGTAGNELSTSLAPLGTWSRVQGNTSTGGDWTSYSNVSAVSGSLAARFDADAYDGIGYHPALIKEGLTPFDSFYISWWMYLPVGDTFSGCPGACNWKTVWVCASDSCTDADVTPAAVGSSSWVIFGNDYPTTNWFDFSFSNGTWYRFGWWQRGRTTTSGENKIWITQSSGTAIPSGFMQTGIATLNSGDTGKRQFISVNGYIRSTSNSHNMFDDVYIATGEYAQARVEIGNASTYDNCSRLAMVTPTSWSASSITGVVRSGNIPNGNAWLYVTDSSGNRSSGYAITMGGQGITAPVFQGVTLSGGVNLQ